MLLYLQKGRGAFTLITKQEIIDAAHQIGFADIGFTSAEPFDSHKAILEERASFYDWVYERGMDLLKGTDPKAVYPEVRSIIVLLENYHQEGFPPDMLGKFGLFYMVDDRITKNDQAQSTKQFRALLSANGIHSKSGASLLQRLAAARSVLCTFGKNCLFYANKAARQSSWVFPVVLLVDQEFSPD